MRNKNLFTGAVGKISEQGGARMYTTPNTIYVPPEYEIETGISKDNKFITCSLDGRMWLFNKNIIVLNWNENPVYNTYEENKKGKMQYVTSSIINDEENVVARGINWFLTNKSIIKVYDNAPYIQKAALQKNNKSLPIKAENIEKFYSVLPSCGNWQIISSFLILAPDKIIEESDNRLCPYITLEFNYSSYNNVYLSNTENVFLVYHDDTIYAKGSNRIGKIYILPRIIKEKENDNDDDDDIFEEFYIYICPDNLYNEDNIDAEWSNIGLASITKNTVKYLYGFLYSKTDTLSKGLCQRSNNLKIFQPKTNDWNIISEDEGLLYFDPTNFTALSINEKEIDFFNTKTKYTGNFEQWIDPIKKVDSIIENISIAQLENDDVLATHSSIKFYRDFMQNKKLPLTAQSYSKKKFSLGLNEENSITVNSIEFSNESKSEIEWDDIYKCPFEIKIKEIEDWDNTTLMVPGAEIIHTYNHIYYWAWFTNSGIFDISDEDYWPYAKDAEIRTVDINEAKFLKFNEYISLPSSVPKKYVIEDGGSIDFIETYPEGVSYIWDATYSRIDNIILNINEITFEIDTFHNVPSYFAYIANIENPYSQVKSWNDNANETLVTITRSEKIVDINNSDWEEFDNTSFKLIRVKDSCAYFQELSSGTIFGFKSEKLNEEEIGKVIFIGNYSKRKPKIFNYKYENKSLENAHIIITDKGTGGETDTKGFILYSKLKKDIFDFDAEIKRSKLF